MREAPPAPITTGESAQPVLDRSRACSYRPAPTKHRAYGLSDRPHLGHVIRVRGPVGPTRLLKSLQPLQRIAIALRRVCVGDVILKPRQRLDDLRVRHQALIPTGISILAPALLPSVEPSPFFPSEALPGYRNKPDGPEKSRRAFSRYPTLLWHDAQMFTACPQYHQAPGSSARLEPPLFSPPAPLSRAEIVSTRA